LADPPRDPTTQAIIGRYSKLEKDGIAAVGSRIEHSDVYVNKQTPRNANDNSPSTAATRETTAWRDCPLVYRSPHIKGYVDKVLITDTDQEQLLVKVLMRQTRVPELGDKFSSRHGQKGVCGLIVPQIDMPFTDDGIQPDVIMNPHGFPSRMTVGKMLELLSGKAGLVKGKFEYGTAFGGSKAEESAPSSSLPWPY
jgi:DNA-directed RNA polymerase III subunit RPC2